MAVHRCIAASLVLLGGVSVAAPAAAAPGSDAGGIVAEIQRKMRAYERRYRGVRSRRKVVVEERDGKTGELLKKKELLQRALERRGAQPQIEILGCKVDGRPAAAKDCATDRKQEPMHEVFGADSAKHYAITVRGRKTVAGRACWELAVHPRQQTKRHFKGSLFFSTDDLTLLKMAGTVADLPFPLKSFFIKLLFAKMGDAVVVTQGYVDVWIHVPLITRKRIVSRFSASGHVLLPR